jgi:hypothetical protein
VSYLNGVSERYLWVDLPVGSSNIKKLSIFRSDVDTKHLKNLVRACNGLKKFEPPELLPNLEPQRNSIEAIRSRIDET